MHAWDFSYGCTRTQLWLWRVHRLRVSQTTIQNVVRELGLPRMKPVRKRRPRLPLCSPDDIVAAVCNHFSLRPADLCSKHRSHSPAKTVPVSAPSRAEAVEPRGAYDMSTERGTPFPAVEVPEFGRH